jgi:predicted lipoprotein with Yx(FWY)xxD motif
MIRERRLASLAAPAAVAVTALALAACGSGGSSTATQSNGGVAASAQAPSTSGSSGTVDLASSDLGTILVDPRGRTLYLFRADTGTKSACTGECAAAWPPFVTTVKPTAGSGVKSSLLGISKRAGGTEQVTYSAHPLYLFKGDTASGQTNGQGSTAFGAPWYVLSPAGNQITGASSSAGGSGASSSSTGY